LGFEHAFEPDHMVAVTSIVSKHRDLKKTTLLGAIWGFGHTTTLFIVGIIVLFLKLTIPENIAMSLEFFVGIVIMILGLLVIKDIIVNKKHFHKHTHDESTHMHLHSHKESDTHTHYHKSFLVGLIHGIAGSAALMLLILSTISSIPLGIAYILIFGLGSMIGMAIVGGMISLPFVLTSKKYTSFNTSIRYITGIFSIAFGAFILIKIGYLEGLFIF
jgi:sulfite exporter TauE/SafE